MLNSTHTARHRQAWSSFRRVMITAVGVFSLLGMVLVHTARSVSAQTDDSLPTEYQIPGDKAFPESITFQEKSGDFYVSSYGDGTIFKGNVSQSNLTIFLPPGLDGRTAIGGVKLDNQGHLFVCGAGTGLIWVYDTTTKALIAKLDTDAEPNTVINDMALDANGNAYVTDSLSPMVYKVSHDATGKYAVEKWLDLTSTVITYTTGLNLNGIAMTDDQKYLLAAATNTGKLFRIDIASKSVQEIDLGDQPLLNTDGILLRGTVLYAARNADNLVAVVDLSADYTKGTLRFNLSAPSLKFPVSIVDARGRLFILNGQLDKLGQGSPTLPFRITALSLPTLSP